MSLETQIRNKRLRLGWTQVHLGKIVGVKQATISRVESNAKSSSWGLIEKILIALEVEIADMTTITQKLILKESEFDLFIKVIFSKIELKTYILYHPVYCAKVIINAFNNGLLDFNKKTQMR